VAIVEDGAEVGVDEDEAEDGDEEDTAVAVEVPAVSEKQRGLVHAVLRGDSNKMPFDVAREFAAKDKGGKLPLRSVRRRIGKKCSSGRGK
jgi:hypothetical protein